jgi:hypothetical protein
MKTSKTSKAAISTFFGSGISAYDKLSCRQSTISYETAYLAAF